MVCHKMNGEVSWDDDQNFDKLDCIFLKQYSNLFV